MSLWATFCGTPCSLHTGTLMTVRSRESHDAVCR